jgi:GT2 family glycosyltransferase
MSKIWLSYVSYPVTTAVYFERAFRKIHDVTTIGPQLPQEAIELWDLQNMKLPILPQDIPTDFDNCDIEALYNSAPENQKPEYFIWIESVPGFFPKNIKKLPIKTACYLIDTHLHLKEHFELAKNFDYVFLAQREYIENFNSAGMHNVYWLPLGADPEIHAKLSEVKKHEIGFVGSFVGNERRVKLLERLGAKFPVHYERAFWTDMSKVFSESKIVFNNAVRNDLNMRVFEVMSTGSFLLTDLAKKSGQDELFVNNEDLGVYEDDFIENVADFYLRNDELREAIAARGKELILNAHKYSDRAEDMLKVISEKKNSTCSAKELREKSTRNITITSRSVNKLKRSFIIPVIDYSPASKYNIKTLLDDLEKIEGEVIVIFNSEEVANEIKNDPRIDQYAIMKMNVGVSRAWNIGLHIARTPLAFIVNSDVHVEKETIVALENALISLPKAASVGPQGSFFRFETAEDIQYFDKGTFAMPIVVDAVSGFLFGVRTEYFHNGTLIFENAYTPAYFEEWDLGLRIKRASLLSYIVPATAYEHEWSGSIRSMRKIKFYDKAETPAEILERNKRTFLNKWREIAEKEGEKDFLISGWVNVVLAQSKMAINNGKFDDAEKFFRLLIDVYPNLDIGYKNLGLLYTALGKENEAKQYLQKAEELSTRN